MPPLSRQRRLFSLEQANRALPLVSRIVEDIVRVHRRIVEVYQEAQDRLRTGDTEEAERLQDLLQELHYEQSEYLDELDKIGCELKDADLGLVDFPAELGGRIVWLCWKLGETRIDYWHELHAGFQGRRPVKDYF